MSFWPLAKILTEELGNAAANGPLVEVGCGAGTFARCLARAGFDVIALDRDISPLRTLREQSPDRNVLQARGESLPFADASLAAILCANLLRNAREEWDTVLRSCWDALARGGILVILEDDADDVRPDARNYRETLSLLAAVDPSRGSPLVADEIEALCEPAFGPPVASGTLHNELPVQDPEMPLRWLASRELAPVHHRELMELELSVREHGMAYGRYLFQIYRKGPACAA